MDGLTHASFFSGVGGLDLGLERAGWRTVSFSEIDPYANAVLAERWPGVPNLGDIVPLADWWRGGQPAERAGMGCGWGCSESGHGEGCSFRASLWSGGFPCQDLSVAGKRAGFAGERSSLAFAFLDLVARHRPPAVLLENVPGLLSSHAGRDFGALLGTLAELRYGWAYRILDARHFGVPQRRRRVFIVALDTERGLGAERAAEVLSVGTRCDRHPATGHTTGAGVAGGTGDGTIGTFTAGAHPGSYNGQDAYTGHLISPPPDAGRVRAADGVAGRVDDSSVGPLLTNAKGGQRSTDLNTPLAFVKAARVSGPGTPESWVQGETMNTLNSFDVGDVRTTAAIIGNGQADDPLLPIGLDSHRYRCAGNGVVSHVAEFIGWRLGLGLAAVFA